MADIVFVGYAKWSINVTWICMLFDFPDLKKRKMGLRGMPTFLIFIGKLKYLK